MLNTLGFFFERFVGKLNTMIEFKVLKSWSTRKIQAGGSGVQWGRHGRQRVAEAVEHGGSMSQEMAHTTAGLGIMAEVIEGVMRNGSDVRCFRVPDYVTRNRVGVGCFEVFLRDL